MMIHGLRLKAYPDHERNCFAKSLESKDLAQPIIFAARDLGVKVLTLYAFSVENWKRAQEEVGALMGLLELYLKKELKTFVRDRVRLRTIGRVDELSAGVQKLLKKTVEETAAF